MHWLGPFIVEEIKEYVVAQLAQLEGTLRPRWMNGTHQNPYYGP